MLSKCYGDDAQPDARPPPPPAAAADGHSHSHEHGDHSSEVVALGTVQLQGSTFAVDREGECEAGKSCTFGVEAVGAAREAPSDAWVENAAGERVCEPVTGEGHDKHWHFTLTPNPAGYVPATFVLQVGKDIARIDLLNPGCSNLKIAQRTIRVVPAHLFPWAGSGGLGTMGGPPSARSLGAEFLIKIIVF